MWAKIAGIGHSVPESIRGNGWLSRHLETDETWILERTGIEERRVADDSVATSDLIVEAARTCLASAQTDVSEVDAIVVATMTPDYPTPSTASVVQHRLGARNAWGFDVSAACAGFVFGLTTANALVRSGQTATVLLCCGERMSSIVDPDDRGTAILFGDGAAALLVVPTDDPTSAILDASLYSDGSGCEHLLIPSGGSASPTSTASVRTGSHFLRQNGRTVFRHAVEKMTESTRISIERNDVSIDDLDWFIPHNANRRIMDAVADRLAIPSSRIGSRVRRFGNTASASIPLCLSMMHEDGLLEAGDRILTTAFGAGYAWGTVYMRWGVSSSAHASSTVGTEVDHV